MTALIQEIAEWALLAYVAYAVWKGLKLIFRIHDWLDRDQDILNQIEGHEPETMSLEEAEVIAIHVADITREQAIFAFMDAYDERYSNERH